MSQEFLDRSDLVTILQAVGGEGAPRSVEEDPPRSLGLDAGAMQSALDHALTKMVSPALFRLALELGADRGEEPVPVSVARHVREFPRDRVRQRDVADAGANIGAVKPASSFRLRCQRGAQRLGSARNIGSTRECALNGPSRRMRTAHETRDYGICGTTV
jgi:hypothetical protein